jgi:hypothetical protein
LKKRIYKKVLGISSPFCTRDTGFKRRNLQATQVVLPVRLGPTGR